MKLIFMFVNVGTSLLVYIISRKLFNNSQAVSMFFALLMPICELVSERDVERARNHDLSKRILRHILREKKKSEP